MGQGAHLRADRAIPASRSTTTIYLLLATALATKVSWDRPFELAPGSALGEASPWSNDVKQVLVSPLVSPQHLRHKAFLASTIEAGEVGVHVGRAQDGLVVASVIAAADVPAVDVLSAGHRVAIDVARNRPVAMRSLFDLPLGDGPLWSVREEMSPDGPGERCRAVLPAWEARTVHDLSDARLGFAAAASALGRGSVGSQASGLAQVHQDRVRGCRGHGDGDCAKRAAPRDRTEGRNPVRASVCGYRGCRQ